MRVMQCQTREGDGREGCVGVAVISILYDKNRVCKYWQGEGREKSKNQSEFIVEELYDADIWCNLK